ncbi:DUF397 domain-containing protein [Streptomyces echinoruber]|uniref:DUF397 domain-containing protein n=1 Tax=Streptomyces echinoruber TaxID=68898 RepID=A0A918R211_9ACTN|nr:DUF397 domain-containing protein [Streptomyces echinoruber]GGZ82298.1 hypothetical protein GCM10010389_20310 [Streptomyces echinoruber]
MTKPLNWQKSTYSGGGDGDTCIELAASAPTTLHLRESDDPVTVLTTTRGPLAHLLDALRAGSLGSWG